MKSYTFIKNSAYTSHHSLSGDKERGIEASNYSEYPSALIFRNKKIEYEELLEKYNWSERRTRAGYAEVEPGIFVRFKTLSHSPDYFKINGCGNCIFELKIRSSHSLKFEFLD